MVGGITPGNSYGYPGSTQGLPRPVSDSTRPSVAIPARDTETVPDRTAQAPAADPGRSADSQPERRVEARQAAEDVRLETFRADEMPLQTSKALSVFAAVAATGDDSAQSGSLAGIDLLV